MKHLTLKYNNEQFTVAVDDDTYLQLIEDENKLYDYAQQAYNFIHSNYREAEEASRANIGNTSCAENEQTSAMATTEDTTDYSDKENFKWTHKLTLLLIDLRLKKEREFNRPVCKKKKLWDIIANEITNATHINVNGNMCDSKYRNLLCTYKSNKKKSEQSGEDAIKWEYYRLFDEVLGCKASSLPSKHVLGDIPSISGEGMTKQNQNVTEKKLKNTENVTEETNLPIIAEVPGYSMKKGKTGKKETVTLGDYLSFKQKEDREKRLEQEKRREERWLEKKKLKEREISAIEKLADALAGKYAKSKPDEDDSE